VETVTDLGAGREVKIRLLWQPRLLHPLGLPSRGSLSLLGFLCLGVGTLTSMHKDRNPPLPGRTRRCSSNIAGERWRPEHQHD
jgi:hypothetical protein